MDKTMDDKLTWIVAFSSTIKHHSRNKENVCITTIYNGTKTVNAYSRTQI